MAISFDGTDDQIDWGDVDSLDGLAALTVSAWIKVRTGSATFAYIVSKHQESPGNGWAFLTWAPNTTAAVLARNGENTSNAIVAGAITLDTFMHWLYIYDGAGAANADRLKLYLNGTQQTLTFVGTVPATIGAHADTMLYAGNRNAAGFGSYDIAEVGIWPGVAINRASVIKGLSTDRFCPLIYKHMGLTFHDHGIRGARDIMGLATPTVTGTTVVAHPRMIYPRTRSLVAVPAAAAAATAIFNRQHTIGRGVGAGIFQGR